MHILIRLLPYSYWGSDRTTVLFPSLHVGDVTRVLATVCLPPQHCTLTSTGGCHQTSGRSLTRKTDSAVYVELDSGVLHLLYALFVMQIRLRAVLFMLTADERRCGCTIQESATASVGLLLNVARWYNNGALCPWADRRDVYTLFEWQLPSAHTIVLAVCIS